MMTRLSSALGLGLLVASLSFGGSFACSNSQEAQSISPNAVAAENEGSLDQGEAALTESEAVLNEQSQSDETEALSSASSEDYTDLTALPAEFGVAAIVAEITQSVTIAAPGQILDEQPADVTAIETSAAEALDLVESEDSSISPLAAAEANDAQDLSAADATGSVAGDAPILDLGSGDVAADLDEEDGP